MHMLAKNLYARRRASKVPDLAWQARLLPGDASRGLRMFCGASESGDPVKHCCFRAQGDTGDQPEAMITRLLKSRAVPV